MANTTTTTTSFVVESYSPLCAEMRKVAAFCKSMEKVLNRFSDLKQKVYEGAQPRTVNVLLLNKGEEYEEGSFYGPGIYHRAKNTVVVTPMKYKIFPFSSKITLLHELGHALDPEMGVLMSCHMEWCFQQDLDSRVESSSHLLKMEENAWKIAGYFKPYLDYEDNRELKAAKLVALDSYVKDYEVTLRKIS